MFGGARTEVWARRRQLVSHFSLWSPEGGWSRTSGAGSLTLDIVDYPGEWLLDLPLLGKSYEEWSAEAMHPPGTSRNRDQ